MSLSRPQESQPDVFSLEYIRLKIKKINDWIYTRCKSRPIRYLVSIIAGGGAAIAVVGGLAFIKITGPISIIAGLVTFIIVSIRENQKAIGMQKFEQLQLELRGLQSSKEKQSSLLNEHEMILQQALDINQETHKRLNQIEESNLQILTHLAELFPDNKELTQHKKIFANIDKKKLTNIDRILPTVSVHIPLPTHGAPPYDVYNPNYISSPEAKAVPSESASLHSHFSQPSSLSDEEALMKEILESVPVKDRPNIPLVRPQIEFVEYFSQKKKEVAPTAPETVMRLEDFLGKEKKETLTAPTRASLFEFKQTTANEKTPLIPSLDKDYGSELSDLNKSTLG